MEAHQQYLERAKKLREDAQALFDEANQDGTDEARAAELVLQGERMVDRSLEWDERSDKAKRIAADRIGALHRDFDGPPEKTNADGSVHADTLNRETSTALIRKRVEVQERIMGGERMDDADAKLVGERLPHELLYQRMMFRNHPDPNIQTHVTDDEIKAFREGMEAEVRAFTPYMGTNQASHGAHTVPTMLSNRIIVTMAYTGHMGSLSSGVMLSLLEPGQKLDISQITDAHEGEVDQTAEGEDGTLRQVTTNSISLVPKKRTYHFAITEEIVRSNIVNFEQRLVQLVSSFFGRTMNKDLTNGDGSGSNSSGLTSPAKGPTNVVSTATAGAITEAEMYALYALLDPAYEMSPAACYQAHKTTLVKLMQLKGQGDYRAFPLDPMRKMPLLPGAKPTYYNQALTALKSDNTSGQDLIVFGDLACYELAHTALRQATQYEVLDDKYVLGFFMSWDGDYGDTRGVVRMESV